MALRKQPGDTSCGYDKHSRLGSYRNNGKNLKGGLRDALRGASLQNGGSVYNNRFVLDEAPKRPVTLPRVGWMERPVLESTPREILGSKVRADEPSSTEYLRNLAAKRAGQALKPPDIASIASMISKGGSTSLAPKPDNKLSPKELDDTAIVLAGQVAWMAEQKSSAKENWFAIGAALLVGSKLCQQMKGRYQSNFHDWLEENNFQGIDRETRRTAIKCAQNEQKVRNYLSTLPPAEAFSINHAQIMWRHYERHVIKNKSKPVDLHIRVPNAL
jgi:hypothetical protein